MGATENEENVLIISGRSKMSDKLRKTVTIDDRFEILILFSFSSNLQLCKDSSTGISIIHSGNNMTIIGIPNGSYFEFVK